MDSPEIVWGTKRVDPQVENSLWFCVLNSGERAGYGGIAQLVERLVRNEKARGSNPLTSNPESSRGKAIPLNEMKQRRAMR